LVSDAFLSDASLTIKGRVEAVRERMEKSASRASRRVSEVKLLAVTKTRTVEEMLEAAPLVDGFGENRVQEAASKKLAWPVSAAVEWRLIGHLQTNKARKAVTLFDSIDSLDSAGATGAVERIAAEGNRTLPVLIEVNTSGEASKTGAAPEGFPELLDTVLACPHLRLDGLMTIGPLTDAENGEALARGAFAMLRGLAEEARLRSGLPLPVLSMGMSGDFEPAIAEGSTMIRIGEALFGQRQAVREL
jgi:pyridoxal phosphate enzyme (YggS family)